jgi:hypothetical protein
LDTKGVRDLKKIILTVGSATYAVKARRLLEKEKITARVIKTESVDKSSGCIHGVEIPYSDFLMCVMILKNHGIEYKVHGT